MKTHIITSQNHIIKANTLEAHKADGRNIMPDLSRQPAAEHTPDIPIHSKRSDHKFNFLLLFFILFFSGAFAMLIRVDALNEKDIQHGIAEKILRFHVLANSDSNEDQALKLIVKDTLVTYLTPLVKDAADITQVRTIVTGQLTQLKELAQSTIRQQGCSYPVTVSLEETYFPLKIYGKFTFPPGYYQALRVKIGKAEGQNWWCVMFPPLCFVDETYNIVDENSGDKLLQLLSNEEYDELLQKKVPVKIRFKLLDKIKELLT